MSVEPSIINAKGDMSVNWRNWYAEQNGVTLEKARYIQIDRFFKMPEPSLKLEDGKRNPMWVLWWKITKRVSTNIALKQWVAKVDGTFVKDKRRTNYLDAHLRKLQQSEDKMKTPRFYPAAPFIKLGDNSIEVDRRLGQGELSLEQLAKTNLGLKILNKLAERHVNYAEVIQEAILNASKPTPPPPPKVLDPATIARQKRRAAELQRKNRENNK